VQGEEAEGGDAREGDPVPDPDFLPIQGQKGTGSRIRIRYTDRVMCREKMVVMRDPGSGSRFRNPDFLPIPDPGIKKAPDPGSATLLVCTEKKQKAVMRDPVSGS
jgi:hypothetical protein